MTTGAADVRQKGSDNVESPSGKWRGGEGIVRDYRLTAETATTTATCGRHEFPPWGVDGGHDGSRPDGGYASALAHWRSAA